MWGLDEDDALKDKLSGFTVPNYGDLGTSTGKRNVAVYFRFPDAEERQRTFPHIAIDLIEINFAPERGHRAMEFILDYDTELATPLSGFKLVGDDYPLPWDLVYQLGVYSRNPRQDRQLQFMLYQMFPEQYGSLDMTKYDGTIRRADLVGQVRRDTVDSSNNRLYRNIFTVSISSEFFLNQIRTVQQATDVKISVLPYVDQAFPVPA